MLKRYGGGISWVMKMPVKDFEKLVVTAKEKDEEEQAKRQWLQLLPLMSMKFIEFKPFSEYLSQIRGENIDMRPNEEIIEEIKKLHGIEEI